MRVGTRARATGLPERDAPFGASVSTFGVETNTVPASPTSQRKWSSTASAVLEVLDRLQEHDGVSLLGEALHEIAREA